MKISLPPDMPGFQIITEYDPDVEYAHLKHIVKRGIGVQEFIKIGDIEIPIVVSPCVPDGHIYVITERPLRIPGFKFKELADAFARISITARHAADYMDSLKGAIKTIDNEENK